MDTGGDTFHSFQCKIGREFSFFLLLLFVILSVVDHQREIHV